MFQALRGLALAALLGLATPGVVPAGIDDPPADGFKVLYVFTGARSEAAPGGSVATSIHCSNMSSGPVWVRTEYFDQIGNQLAASQLQIGGGRTETFSSRATEFYADNAGSSVTMLMGTVRVSSDGTTRVVCAAQVLDPLHDPPWFIVSLPGFNRKGVMR